MKLCNKAKQQTKMKLKQLPEDCEQKNCRGVFHYREAPFRCYIPESEAIQMIKGTGQHLR